MDKKEFAHIQRYKLFSSSKIEKVVSEITCPCVEPAEDNYTGNNK